MRERDIEAHLVKRVKELGGTVRKLKWEGRSKAPDRFVAIPLSTMLVEVKNPDTIKTFPSNAHERAQAREHKRLRAAGVRVEVVGTIEGVEDLLR